MARRDQAASPPPPPPPKRSSKPNGKGKGRGKNSRPDEDDDDQVMRGVNRIVREFDSDPSGDKSILTEETLGGAITLILMLTSGD